MVPVNLLTAKKKRYRAANRSEVQRAEQGPELSVKKPGSSTVLGRLLNLDVDLGRAQEENTRGDTFNGSADPENYACRKINNTVGNCLRDTGQIEHDRDAVADSPAHQLCLFICFRMDRCDAVHARPRGWGMCDGR